jgi:hypothetical protein
MSAAERQAIACEPLPETRPESWTDRASRLTTILMVGRLVAHGRDYLCRMRNVSTGGMMVECDAALAPGDRVRVELRNLNVVDGEVMWAAGPRVGLRFDGAIDVTDLFQVPPERREQRPRAPRLTGAGRVRLHHEGRDGAADLCDVSQSGCRLSVTKPLPIGAVVRLTVRGLPQRRATVRWAEDGLAGFEFTELLSFAELTTWQRDTGRFSA